MASSGYTVITFVADELLTSTKMNQMGANDAAFNNGNGFEDSIIITRHLLAANVTPPKISDFDWFKNINPMNFFATSGTWTLANAATSGNPIMYRYTNTGSVANEYIEFKTVLAAGTYSIGWLYDKDVNRGIATLAVDGSTTGSTIDTYAGSRSNAEFGNFTTTYVVSTNKLVTIRLTGATKNASSIGYILGVMGVILRRSA